MRQHAPSGSGAGAMTEPRTLPLYQIDAFAAQPFSGNPAAVCPLDRWLPDPLMQQIAAENNLAETAFFVADGEDYHLRWFTPQVEVPLCGHATLASAFVIFEYLRPELHAVGFRTASGRLDVSRESDSGMLAMRLPARESVPFADDTGQLVAALGREPQLLLRGDYDMAVFGDAGEVQAVIPDMTALAKWERGVIITAPAPRGERHYDVISRFFVPAKGVPEDAVTGSAHCQIVPYWCARLGRADLKAFQASSRGGFLHCSYDGGAYVVQRGYCIPYLEGSIRI